MSKFNDAVLWAVLAWSCAAGAAIAAVVADPVPTTVAAGDKARTADVSKAAEPTPKPAKPVRNQIRCWQEGRLVFDASGYAPVQKPQIVAELKSQGLSTQQATLQVLDLKNGLCILEYGAQ
jgi:hypothetical protein